jgi:Toprim-like
MQTHQLSIDDFRAVDPEGGRGGRWLCPVPGQCAEHTDPRRHRSVSMRSDDGRWNCKRCGAQGQVKEFWKEPAPREARQFVDYKTRKGLESQARRRELEISLAPKKEVVTTGGITPKIAAERSGTLGSVLEFPEAKAFLESRGFDSQSLPLLHSIGVRFAPDFGRNETWSGCAAIVFPVRDGVGKFCAVQGRRLRVSEGSKKVLTFGPRSRGLFSTFNFAESRAYDDNHAIAICEAPLDALALAVAGYAAVALCGCSGLPEWFLSLSVGRRYWLAFDADEAGDKAAEQIGAAIQGAGGITARLKPTGAKDWAEVLKNFGQMRLRLMLPECLAPGLQRDTVIAERALLGRLALGHGPTRAAFFEMQESGEAMQWSDGGDGLNEYLSRRLVTGERWQDMGGYLPYLAACITTTDAERVKKETGG